MGANPPAESQRSVQSVPGQSFRVALRSRQQVDQLARHSAQSSFSCHSPVFLAVLQILTTAGKMTFAVRSTTTRPLAGAICIVL